jgi:hypothetical protein
MPSRERLNEFIAVVESGDHAGAIERYYTEDSSMQENAAAPASGATCWSPTNAACWRA